MRFIVSVSLALLLVIGCSPADRQETEKDKERIKKHKFSVKVAEPKTEEIAFWALKAPPNAVIRAPAKLGTGWAPGTEEGLLRSVREYIGKAEPVDINGRVVGLLVPHAGYVFSGPVAGYAYRAIMGERYDTVVIIGTSHSGLSSVAKFDFYRMPFGDVPLLDKKSIDAFTEKSGLEYIPAAHKQEHSVELQLPFLCAVLKDFRILPILISSDIKEPKRVADALSELMKDGKTLIVISSDLSHWPPYDIAVAMDKEFLDALSSLNVDKLLETNRKLLSREWLSRFGVTTADIGCAACGLGAIVVSLHLFGKIGVDGFKLIKYANSYDTAKGDRSGVVGYAACAFFVRDRKEKTK